MGKGDTENSAEETIQNNSLQDDLEELIEVRASEITWTTSKRQYPLRYPLTKEQERKVANIVGDDQLEEVKDIIAEFACKRKLLDTRTHMRKGESRKNIEQARDHISALLEILNDDTTVEYLLDVAYEHFRTTGGKLLVVEPYVPIDITPKPTAIGILENLDAVCEKALRLQQPGRGRPKGQKDEAAHFLLNRLYNYCLIAEGQPLTTKPGNRLERLVEVLNEPLKLKTDLHGTVRSVIENRRIERN